MKNYAGRNINFDILFNFRENCRDSEYSQWRHKNASGNSEIFPRTFQKFYCIFLTQILRIFYEIEDLCLHRVN